MPDIDDTLRNLFRSKDTEDSFVHFASSDNDDDTKHRTLTAKVDDYDERKEDDEESTKSQQKLLMEIANDNIEILFKDQYSEGFAKIFIKDHYEITPLSSTRFKRFLIILYYDTYNNTVNTESINKVVNTLQAKAEFGDIQYTLSLRVAEYNGDLYYDLTNEKYQSIKISKNGTWELIDQTPIPLFKRYGQIPQTLPFEDSISEDYEDPLETFFSNLTNIKSKEDVILSKVALVTWFIPNIPHIILIVHGGKGSAKTTFLSMIKSIVDPAKPTLFTINEDKSEFIQQLSQNHMLVYDNLRYNPKWLSDEVCKAVTGIGHSKRVLYTVDDQKTVEYKPCLLFNGINIIFSEPDVIDRSITIELSEIKPENRRTEKEILQEFENLKPKILKYIFDVLAKAIVIKKDINIKLLPRMADSSIWGEAIARAIGYKENEFLDAYYNNIKFQNTEVIDSNSVAFTIKKLVENRISYINSISNHKPDSKNIIFIGTPVELLNTLDQIATENKINTNSKEWPKDTRWLVRRINVIKSNLQQELGIEIRIERDSKNNSIIKIENKNASNDSESKTYSSMEGRIEQEEKESKLENKILLEENNQNEKEESIDSEHNSKEKEDISNSSYDTENNNIKEISSYDANIKSPDTFNNIKSNSVAFDLEWIPFDSSSFENSTSSNIPNTKIIAAAFSDIQGNHKVFHIDDYISSFGEDAEKQLLIQINKEIVKYRYSFGWNSTSVSKYDKSKKRIEGIDSDLSILHRRCQANEVHSLVGFDKEGIPYIKEGYHTHIDLYNVFSKQMIQVGIFKNSYRTWKLDEVSKAVLGNEKGGKYEGLDGTMLSSIDIDKQKQYVLKDAQLVMDLVTHNNFQILDCMNAISKITGLEFEKVCKTSLSSWWTSIFDNMVAKGECIKPMHIINNKKNRYRKQQQKDKEEKDEEYVGATVLEPKKGFYQEVDVVDVTSLYPTIAILHNISFDTVNCWCCQSNPEAKVDEKITKDCKIEKEYWICRLKEGAFPKKLKIFREERIKEKRIGSNNTARQLALKILINGGYGVFGNDFFIYKDKKVAELITAFGRYTLHRMQEIAKEKGFEVVAGDTDSLFLLYNDTNNKEKKGKAINKFIEECKVKLNVDVEHQKTFTKFIVLKKKHYLGLTNKGGIISVSIEAIKRDRPLWINNVFKDILNDILIYGNNPITRLKEEIQKLKDGKIDFNSLKIQTQLSMNPQDYKTNNISKKVGTMLNAKAKDLIYYYKSDNKKEGVSISTDDISIKKYEKMLIDSVKEILEVLGYDLTPLYS